MIKHLRVFYFTRINSEIPKPGDCLPLKPADLYEASLQGSRHFPRARIPDVTH